LYRCVNSVIKQSFQPLEIILVNDGCKETLYFQKFVQTDIKIEPFTLPVNSGPAAARNLGIKNSKGNYIAFLDSDDYWGIDKLKNQVSLFKKYASCDEIIIVSPVTLVKSGDILGYRYPIIENNKNCNWRLYKGPYLYLGSTAFFSTKILTPNGYQNPKLRIYEDFEWQIRLVRESNVQFVCSSNPDVYIEKRKRKHSKNNLKKNYLELLSCIKKNKECQNTLLKHITAGYFLDLAVSDLNRQSYFHFIYNLVKSFLIFPRLRIHIAKFWISGKAA